MKKAIFFVTLFLSMSAVAHKHTLHNFTGSTAEFSIGYAQGCNIVAPPMDLAAGAGSSVEADCNVAVVKARIGDGDDAQTAVWKAEEASGFSGTGKWQLTEKDGEFIMNKVE